VPTWLRVGAVAYAVVVAVGVFGPAPGDSVDAAGHRLNHLGVELQERLPLPTSSTTLASADSGSDVGPFSAEDFFNVTLFIPFGVLLPLLWPRIRWWTVPIGVAASCAIELIQGAFLSWRSQSLVDVETNSLGAVIGFGLFLAGLALAYSGNMPRRGSSV
jgi:glycopeptide antibiotics resistance protein